LVKNLGFLVNYFNFNLLFFLFAQHKTLKSIKEDVSINHLPFLVKLKQWKQVK